MIGGNHDLWSGADDPLDWLASQAGTAYEPWEARLELQFPFGNSIRICAQHKWAGNSMWNTAHGITRGVMTGMRDHVALGGHTHVSGRGVLRDPLTGMLSQIVQVASYKGRDDFAKKIGARDNHVSCSATLIIDPENPSPDAVVTVLDNAAEGAEYLTWKRARWRKRRK
jgi:hypothetical protein